MASLDPMQMRILWYVLAGFVLGFITSTLWEWLYFRKQRRQWHSTHAKGADVTTAWRNDEPRRDEPPIAANDDLLWQTSDYRSPGVFLDSEKGTGRPQPPLPDPLTPAFTSAAPRATPAETDPQPATVLPQPLPQVDATVEATLLPERVATPVTIVDVPPTNFVRPIVDGASLQLPSPVYAPTAVERIEREPPAGAALPVLSPPIVIAPAPGMTSEPASTALTSKHVVPRSDGYPDDLTKIQGIGEAYKRRLYAAGLYTWQQVANSAADTLRAITKAKPNARPEEWKTRAQELANKFNRSEARYNGPLPDDLTKVNGIGPTYAEILYRAGICTYEQLASVIPAELAAILPTPAIGNEFNFPDWIRQAIQLANVKQKNMSLLP